MDSSATTTTSQINLQMIIDFLLNWCFTVGVKIVVALVLMFISFAIINALTKWIKEICVKRNVDKTIGKTLRYIFQNGLKILVVLILMSYVGLDISGVTALITTAGLGVGLALQGSLSNVAGGFLIITLRPFRVDDFIEAEGVSGTVEDIHLIYTYIRTGDNKVITLPNGELANSVIINYSKKTTRRVDVSFTVDYSSDHEKAKQIILGLIENHPLAQKTPEPFCRVTEHGDSAIVITAKVWVNADDYWTVYFDLLEQVKVAFDEAGIEIPYNQLDVHIDNKQG